MKPSEVYTRAAELIASGRCGDVFTAIASVKNSLGLTKPFIDYFDMSRNSFGLSNMPKNQRARELALYLMAEISKEWE